MKLHGIRWMCRVDMPQVLAIEHVSYRDARWSDEDFCRALAQRCTIGMVAEGRSKQIVGFMVYRLNGRLSGGRLEILNFAVDPTFRRRGVGEAMVRRLRGKLSQTCRREIVVTVRESNLPAQLFFRSCGFLAVDVWRGWYEDTGEDAFRFSFLLPSE